MKTDDMLILDKAAANNFFSGIFDGNDEVSKLVLDEFCKIIEIMNHGYNEVDGDKITFYADDVHNVLSINYVDCISFHIELIEGQIDDILSSSGDVAVVKNKKESLQPIKRNLLHLVSLIDELMEL